MDADQNDTPYSRSAVTSHLGGCTEAVKVWLPIEIEAEFKQLAARAGAGASEFLRDMIFLRLKGLTYGEFCAKSRRQLLQGEGPIAGRNGDAPEMFFREKGDLP
jgi:hypothetical protein